MPTAAAQARRPPPAGPGPRDRAQAWQLALALAAPIASQQDSTPGMGGDGPLMGGLVDSDVTLGRQAIDNFSRFELE